MQKLYDNWRRYLKENKIREPKLKSKLGVKGQHVDVDSDSEMGHDVENAVVQMVKTTYDPIGGFDSLDSPSKLRNRITNYYLIDIDDDPEPDAGMLYYDAGNNKKSSAIIHDGSKEAKAITRDTMKNLLSQKGNWIEVSGAPEHILRNKLNMPFVDDEGLAEYLVTFGYKRDVGFKWLGDGRYERELGNEKAVKTIFGNVTREMFPDLKEDKGQ